MSYTISSSAPLQSAPNIAPKPQQSTGSLVKNDTSSVPTPPPSTPNIAPKPAQPTGSLVKNDTSSVPTPPPSTPNIAPKPQQSTGSFVKNDAFNIKKQVALIKRERGKQRYTSFLTGFLIGAPLVGTPLGILAYENLHNDPLSKPEAYLTAIGTSTAGSLAAGGANLLLWESLSQPKNINSL